MSFRPATKDDELFFYYWRRRDEAAGIHGGWYGGARTGHDEHAVWFRDRLHTARLLVWEHRQDRLGVARIDSNGELAFSVETQWAVRMLTDLLWFADVYGGRLKVTVDLGDTARAEALEAAGFCEHEARFFAYRP